MFAWLWRHNAGAGERSINHIAMHAETTVDLLPTACCAVAMEAMVRQNF